MTECGMNDGRPKSSIPPSIQCGAIKSINMVLFIYSLPLLGTIKLKSRLHDFCKHIRWRSEVSQAITTYMEVCCETYHSETYFISNINGIVCI